MRPSNKTAILDAAIRLIGREGMSELTFDAVAAEAGVTRGGVIYHFGSREDLVRALHERVATAWEEELHAELGGDPEGATLDDRLIAYIRSSAGAAELAHVRLALDPSDIATEVWAPIYDRWVPAETDPSGPQAQIRQLARLAADGLWIQDALGPRPLPAAERASAAQAIVDLVLKGH